MNPAKALIFTFSLLLLGSAWGSEELLQLEQRIQKTSTIAEQSCLAIQTKAGGSGSAIIASAQGHLFTAAHAVGAPGSEVIAFDSEGIRHTGNVLAVQKELDVALVKLSTQRRWDAPCFGFSTVASDFLVAVGHGGGYNPQRKAPVRFGICLFTKNDTQIVTNCRITVGDSGGGLFDLNGNLAGITTAVTKSGKVYHVKLDCILEVFQPHLPGQLLTGIVEQPVEAANL